jgi:AraC-like DNA-binding protein
MRLYDQPGFDYVPGESVIVPANVEMKIDFPEAAMENPTQCLALAIDNKKILDTLQLLNEKYPKEGRNDYWKLDERNFFFYNNAELAFTVHKLINICQSTSITKDVLADLTLQELLIHIAQCQNLKEVRDGDLNKTHPHLSFIINHIRQNINAKLFLPDIAKMASVSSASLYRMFKTELGISPIEFIVLERIKLAKRLLKDKHIFIKNVSYEVGFDDCNYFIRAFKQHEGITPRQYQQLNLNN